MVATIILNFYLARADPKMVLWGVVTLLFGRGGSRNGVVGRGGVVTLLFGRGGSRNGVVGCCNTSIWQAWIQKWCCGGVVTLLFGRRGSRNGVVGCCNSSIWQGCIQKWCCGVL